MCSPRDRTDSRVLPLHYLFLLQNSRARLLLRMEESKGRVRVTGGTGFIGSWIIKRLLEDGYSVNTTTRSHPEHKKDVSFLTNLPGASQRLQILNAGLSEPESFKEPIEGCMGWLLHWILTKRNLKRLSIDGALGILKACLSSKTVKRVVYTSSAAAVTHRDKEVEVVDESSWTDVDSFRTSKQIGWSYAISKTLTEKAVLEFGEQNGLHVVTLVPTFVVGPFICPKLAGSVGSTLFLTWSLRESTNLKVTDLSSKKLIDAGIVYKYGLEEMLVDAIECCKEKGYL